MLNCEFQNPINLGSDEYPDFEYSNLICEVEEKPTPFEYIETEKGNFWVNKSWTFGELFISMMLVGFLFIVISRSVWGFFYPKLVKFKK